MSAIMGVILSLLRFSSYFLRVMKRAINVCADCPSWPGGEAAPKAQMMMGFKFDMENSSLKYTYPGASHHPSWPVALIERIRLDIEFKASDTHMLAGIRSVLTGE